MRAAVFGLLAAALLIEDAGAQPDSANKMVPACQRFLKHGRAGVESDAQGLPRVTAARRPGCAQQESRAFLASAR
jgi:hypothetical protein